MQATTTGHYKNATSVYESVKNYYGRVLHTSKDLKTSACCTAKRPHKIIRDALARLPNDIISRYYGCGTPLPFGIEGLHVLDLGSGAGRDCYVAASLVGPSGLVTGVDMTKELLEVAAAHVEEYTTALGYPQPNLRFVQGYMEFLAEAGIAASSMDLVISNCVVNLSPDKKRVLANVHEVLKEGGEFYFSDVYCDRRLPEEVRTHEVLLGECIAGALYVEDFKRLCREVGFTDPRILATAPIAIEDEELKQIVGEARFFSITYRLFKCQDLEMACEDYGQYAVYKGTIGGCESSYALDDHHLFEAGKPVLVCGNTADMLGKTWLAPHFQVVGSRERHYGLFGATVASTKDNSSGPRAGCC
jgi:arsenite methyltransferase